MLFSVLRLRVAPWNPSLDPLIIVLDAAEDRDVIGDLSRLENCSPHQGQKYIEMYSQKRLKKNKQTQISNL